jgi:hypothetical protein
MLLVRQLPSESRTFAVLRGHPDAAGWSLDRYLLASLVDAMRENTYAFVLANSKKRVPEPDPVQRPESAAKQRPKNNAFAQMAAQKLAAVRRARGG